MTKISIEINEIKDKLAYLTKLVESLVEERPCAEQAKQESLDLVMGAIKSNPVLQNNPMFKDIIGPLEQMLKGGK